MSPALTEGFAPLARGSCFQPGEVRPSSTGSSLQLGVPPVWGSPLQVGGHPPNVCVCGGVVHPTGFGRLVPPARGYPQGFVAVPAGVTCSPRGALGPLEAEYGEKRQEPPQEVPGQRCGEPEGDGGRVRAGRRARAPPPRAARALPQTSRSRAPMLRLTAAALSANRLRGPSAAIAPLSAAAPPPSWKGTPPPSRSPPPPSWEEEGAGGHVGEVAPSGVPFPRGAGEAGSGTQAQPAPKLRSPGRRAKRRAGKAR